MISGRQETYHNANEEGQAMPDGKRQRRHSINKAKRQWYARYRSIRFHRRFGLADVAFPQATV